tara:strand:+ start:14088 stop:14243 length:156 start_codon:yes stop_codon:yes gene_type:complete
MEIIYIAVYIVIYIAGLATGMYLASQIEKDIDNRTGSDYDVEPEFSKRNKK